MLLLYLPNSIKMNHKKPTTFLPWTFLNLNFLFATSTYKWYYYNSSPLLAMTFLYHSKLFFLRLLRLPLSSLSFLIYIHIFFVYKATASFTSAESLIFNDSNPWNAIFIIIIITENTIKKAYSHLIYNMVFEILYQYNHKNIYTHL